MMNKYGSKNVYGGKKRVIDTFSGRMNRPEDRKISLREFGKNELQIGCDPMIFVRKRKKIF